jgi:hypothetical protein
MTEILEESDPSKRQIWRKKSLPGFEVEAAQVSSTNAAELTAWCGGQLVEEIDPFDSSKRYPGINVPTEQGMERASLGDHIFKVAPGDFRVRTPHAFTNVWEPKQ